MDVMSLLVTKQVLAFAAGIVALVWGIGMIPLKGGRRFNKNKFWLKVLPLVPLLLGVGGAFLPGVLVTPEGDPVPWGEAVVTGLWTGFIAAQGFKIFKRLLVDKLQDRIA